jgi:anhydro-N-acetylmuramic acid kinase
MLVMGLMSGTSADGIDVALARVEETKSSQAAASVRTRGAAMLRPYEEAGGGSRTRREHDVSGSHEGRVSRELVAHATMPLNAAVRKEVLRIAEGGNCTAGEISQLNFRVGEDFAAAAIAACKKFRVRLAEVELIGSHGQTIFHQGSAAPFLGAKTASTLQIGEPSVIAVRTGIPTVGDFRVADMAAGGQGAPLVPYVDYLLLRDQRIGRVALNLGGIGNVTVLEGRRPEAREERTNAGVPFDALGKAAPQVMAFDTGPGNMVIDALVAHYTKGRQRFDQDARMARKGRCFNSLLEELLRDPYLERKPPKSTGREYYGREFVQQLLGKAKKYHVRPDDLVSTATVFTALSVVDALNRFVLPRVEIGQVIVSGGGARNPLIMAQLAAALAPIEVMPLSRLGIPEDAKEAYAFALLAYETWNRRTGNLPSATGARKAVVLGKICWA